MIVKICGITNREDALAAVEGGATALGFNFYPPSPRYIAPGGRGAHHRTAARRRLEGGRLRERHAGAELARDPEVAGLDVAQLHGDETARGPARGRAGSGRLCAWTRAFNPARMDAVPAEAFLLDAPSEDVYGGTGRTFDWTKATRHWAAGSSWPAAWTRSNVRAAIARVRPWGVDACSRLESRPGRKDHVKMARFLKAALSEETE